jgi:hypothetical protein
MIRREEIVKKITIAVCILVLFFIGCSGEYLRESSFHIERGMDEKQVISIMGVPDNKHVSGNEEVWEYKNVDTPGFCYRLFFVWFADGGVTGVTTFKPVTCSHRSGIIFVPVIK